VGALFANVHIDRYELLLMAKKFTLPRQVLAVLTPCCSSWLLFTRRRSGESMIDSEISQLSTPSRWQMGSPEALGGSPPVDPPGRQGRLLAIVRIVSAIRARGTDSTARSQTRRGNPRDRIFGESRFRDTYLDHECSVPTLCLGEGGTAGRETRVAEAAPFDAEPGIVTESVQRHRVCAGVVVL
jgi:hypothetical protein